MIPAQKPKVHITPAARADLLEIRDYIARDNPHVAKKMVQLLHVKCTLLAQTPGIGVNREHYRGLSMFPVGSYLIFYRPGNNGIEIIRVLHTSRDVEKIIVN